MKNKFLKMPLMLGLKSKVKGLTQQRIGIGLGGPVAASTLTQGFRGDYVEGASGPGRYSDSRRP